MHQNAYRFPRWSAPIIGAAAAGFFAAKVAAKDRSLAEPKWILLGVALGALAGCLVFLADRKPEDGFEHQTTDESTVVSRVLALVALPVAVLPLINLAISGISLHLNWRAAGWPKVVSWIALVLSAFFSIGMLIAIVASP